MAGVDCSSWETGRGCCLSTCQCVAPLYVTHFGSLSPNNLLCEPAESCMLGPHLSHREFRPAHHTQLATLRASVCVCVCVCSFSANLQIHAGWELRLPPLDGPPSLGGLQEDTPGAPGQSQHVAPWEKEITSASPGELPAKMN